MSKPIHKIEIIFKKHKPVEEELLICLLLQIKVKLEEIVEEKSARAKRIYFYLKTKEKAKVFREKFKKLKLNNVSLKVASLKKEDWQDKWKETFKPFKITKGIRIVPAWMKEDKEWDDKSIFLDLLMAFGSGLHPTTRYVADFIELEKGKFVSFFDIGCGSGILSLIAQKHGAKDIWCIDIDKEATKNTRHNFKINNKQYKSIKTIGLNKIKSRKKFDFVAANLTAEPLVTFQKKIISCVKKGKFLAVSGIYHTHYKKFMKEFDTSRLKCLKMKKNKKWYAFLYQKNQ